MNRKERVIYEFKVGFIWRSNVTPNLSNDDIIS